MYDMQTDTTPPPPHTHTHTHSSLLSLTVGASSQLHPHGDEHVPALWVETDVPHHNGVHQGQDLLPAVIFVSHEHLTDKQNLEKFR